MGAGGNGRGAGVDIHPVEMQGKILEMLRDLAGEVPVSYLLEVPMILRLAFAPCAALRATQEAAV